jgi:pimeloyl-ACP methyl ester carboxylesterase
MSRSAQREGAPASALLSYDTHGKPQRMALLLVHPLGTDRRFWQDCVDLWKQRFFCITPDLQAAGRSPRPDIPVTIPGHAADLEHLRVTLGIDAVVPIGCALGSMVAACYAATYPQSTRALVMANPGVRNTDIANDMLRQRVEIARRSGMDALLPAAADRAFHNQPRDERYRRHVERFAAQDAQTFARSVEGFIEADITEVLPHIHCPTLVVSGEHDVLMPGDSAEHIKAVVPQAESALMKGAAHFLPYQAPDRFAPMVIDFLDRIV